MCVALDAATGRVFWAYEYRPSPETRVCCGAVNRGLAILGDTLFMGTIDAHLIALDARTGHPLWNVQVADPALGYAVTNAPLVVKDKVIIGPAGGEYGIRGFIAAFDAQDRQRSLAISNDSRTRRARQRNLVRRLVEARRRVNLGYRILRSRTEPDILGNRQSRTRLESATSVPATTFTATASWRSIRIPAS